MKQILLKKGNIYIEEVPAPTVDDDSVLIKVESSCISPGTEIAGIKSSGTSLFKKVFEQPEKVSKVVTHIKNNGVTQTSRLIKKQLNTSFPLGYSLNGKIIKVGKNINSFAVGERVACAGSKNAFHAEIISCPKNLISRVPENVSNAEASTVAIGAIALQSIRRAQSNIGEIFVVIGLGFIGQITHQILNANGVKTIGIDPDTKRLEIARSLGLHDAYSTLDTDTIEYILKLTDGYGADGVIITASSTNNEIISRAFNCTRKKGRVVLVGDVGLDIQRSDIYQKEIDFLISTSYGPGRYDDIYENQGVDYPLPYVRWTENRNMEAYLSLLSDERINIKPLIKSKFDINDAKLAYDSLNNKNKPFTVILNYQSEDIKEKSLYKIVEKKIDEKKAKLAVIGAGNFAIDTLIPILKKEKELCEIKTVLNKHGHKCVEVAKQFDIPYAATNFDEVLNDREITAVVISNRHNLHAEMVLASLKAGKHVFVEKPLCINESELKSIKDYFSKSDESFLLMTGFNRRFSPLISQIMKIIEKRKSPMIINYQVNAGYISPEHWVHGKEGGGRNIGEACHFYDLFTFLTGSKVIDIQAASISTNTNYYLNKDNFSVNLTFEDGSLANLTYTALGNVNYPKEILKIYVDNNVFEIVDYKKISDSQGYLKKNNLNSSLKGYEEELNYFLTNINKEKYTSLPLWQQFQAMEIAFAVEKKISGN